MKGFTTKRSRMFVCLAIVFGLTLYTANVHAVAESFTATRPANVRMSAPSNSHVSYFTIRIDTSNPKLYVYEGSDRIRTYPVSLGAPQTQTPIGVWHVVDKQQDWGGGFGSRWLGLNVPWGTYGIHGTNRPESIGRYVSNGCIRMLNEDVQELYDILPIGTPVVISGDVLAHRRVLRNGDIGADVQLVQQRLKDRGFYLGPCNGRFTSSTQLALFFYEISHGLIADCVVGMDDYRALGLLK